MNVNVSLRDFRKNAKADGQKERRSCDRRLCGYTDCESVLLFDVFHVVISKRATANRDFLI